MNNSIIGQAYYNNELVQIIDIVARKRLSHGVLIEYGEALINFGGPVWVAIADLDNVKWIAN